jgi:hypothetical protein
MTISSSKLRTIGHCRHSLTSSRILKLGIAQAKLNAKACRVSGGKLASLGCLGGSPAYDGHDVKAPSAGKNVTFDVKFYGVLNLMRYFSLFQGLYVPFILNITNFFQ